MGLKIKLFQCSPKVQPETESHGKAFLKDLDVDTLTSYTSNFIGLTLSGVSLLCIHRLDNIEMKQLNKFPNYLCAYYINLLAPCVGIVLFIASFFRKAKIRKSFKEELENMICCQ
jgi:Na+/H+-dicarboxylate symporter